MHCGWSTISSAFALISLCIRCCEELKGIRMFSGAWLVDSNMVYPPFVKLIWVYISVGVNFLMK